MRQVNTRQIKETAMSRSTRQTKETAMSGSRSRFLGVLVVLSLAAVLAGVCPGQAQAAMYFDDFSGSGASALNGTTPDITMGAATWTAYTTGENNGFRDDGYIPEWWDGYKTATLPFVPDAGKVYTLSAVMDADPRNAENYNSDPVGITFGGGPGLKIYDNSAGEVYSTGLGGDVKEGNYGKGAITAKIVLDTTAALWEAEWFVNDVSVRGPEAYTINPTITTITLWKDWMAGSWDDLTLTPEPATLSLLFLGGLAMLRRRRAA
jgi:hypothetical protein